MAELKKLDAYLSADRAPEKCMQLSDLDGFLTGVICSPNLIPPSTWLPVAMGTSENVEPWIIEQIIERYNEIVAGLNAEPPVLEPIFWQAKEGHVIAVDWCEGFYEALSIQKIFWDALPRSSQGREWMFPILAHLLDNDGKPVLDTKEEQMDAVLDAAAELIPQTVPHIFAYWQAKQCSARSN